jgi:hypothetical protein
LSNSAGRQLITGEEATRAVPMISIQTLFIVMKLH